jgi:hypothetical protein
MKEGANRPYRGFRDVYKKPITYFACIFSLGISKANSVSTEIIDSEIAAEENIT